ncbi:hypothetical protein GCM10020219_038450 [Nonomuraea dietziae]
MAEYRVESVEQVNNKGALPRPAGLHTESGLRLGPAEGSSTTPGTSNQDNVIVYASPVIKLA